MANEIPINIVAHDRASREIGRVADEMREASKDASVLAAAAEGAGDSMREMGRDADHLNRRLADTERHMQSLARELAHTGDVGLLKDIGKDRRLLNQLTQAKRLLGEVADEGEDVGKRTGRSMLRELGTSLAQLPLQLKGVGIAAGAAVAVSLAPVIGAAVSGAVLGGVGAGGIIGGIALAAQDPAVKAAGSELGQSLLGSFTEAGQPFVDPLLASMRELDDIGADFAADLQKNFAKIAPTLKPLTKGLDGFLDALGPGLSDAFDAAAPVLRMLAAELPKLGDALSDALSAISQESDGAIMALKGLFQFLESSIRIGGDVIAWLSAAYENLVRFGAAVTGVVEDVSKFVPTLFLASKYAGFWNDRMEEQIAALGAAKSPLDDYAGGQKKLGDETIRTTTALQKQAAELRAQTDPMFALTSALSDMEREQGAYNEAVKEHGKDSKEAKDASLRLAQAALTLQGAVAGAAGTFDGKLDPAFQSILEAAGLTKRQIRDVEKAFQAAKTAGDKFVSNSPYMAQLVFHNRSVAQTRAINEGRASGGPVKAGRTYVVGEEGPEVVTFGEDGFVHDAAQSRAMMAGSPVGGVAMAATAAAPAPQELRLPNASGGLDRMFLSWLQGLLTDNNLRLVSN